MAKDNDRKQRVQEAVKEIRVTIDDKNLTPIDAFHLKYGEKTRQCGKQGKNPKPIQAIYESALLRFGGKVWPVLEDNLVDWLTPEAIETVNRESGEILNLIVGSEAGKAKRKGLVVGYVQSGKTTNYSAVIAKAIDQGYRFIIVLAGMHNILREQTQKRLEDYIEMAFIEIDKNIQLLTHRKADIDMGVSWRPESASLAVVKKQSDRLQALLDLMEKAKSEDKLDNVKVLIIDDESDQATPNTAEQREEYSKVNKLIRQIWDQVQQGSYVAYTATPFANVLMHPKEEERSSDSAELDNLGELSNKRIERYPGLYPSDFVYALDCPKGYIGVPHFFGSDAVDEVAIDAVRYVEEEEAKILRALAQKEEQTDKKHDWEVPGLQDAVHWFMIATALRRLRVNGKQHSSMMIHLSHKMDNHFEARQFIEEYVSSLKQDYGKPEKDKAMRDLYEREVNRMQGINPNKVYPAWDDLKIDVVDVINDTKGIVKNSSMKNQKEELVYKEDEPATYIVIGGNALSRGLTLEGLVSSYYIRESKNYDSLLQMGRWFGFRPGYEDLIRLWTTVDIQEDYCKLAEVEDQLRDEIRKVEEPSKTAIKVLACWDELNVTSRNKMRNAAPVNINHSGKSYQVTRFEEQDDKLLKRNIQALESLIESIRSTHKELQIGSNGSYLFEGVPVKNILAYLKDYEAHPLNSEVGSNELIEWIDKNIADNWNVVIYSDTDENRPKRDFAGYEIRMADRTAVKSKSTEGIVDIKSLANPLTYVLDLRILAHHGKIKISEADFKNAENNNDDERKLFRSSNGNFPLLFIYVVNPESKANRPNRRDLKASTPVVLHTIVLPEIVGSDKEGVSVGHLIKNSVEPSEKD